MPSVSIKKNATSRVKVGVTKIAEQAGPVLVKEKYGR